MDKLHICGHYCSAVNCNDTKLKLCYMCSQADNIVSIETIDIAIQI